MQTSITYFFESNQVKKDFSNLPIILSFKFQKSPIFFHIEAYCTFELIWARDVIKFLVVNQYIGRNFVLLQNYSMIPQRFSEITIALVSFKTAPEFQKKNKVLTFWIKRRVSACTMAQSLQNTFRFVEATHFKEISHITYTRLLKSLQPKLLLANVKFHKGKGKIRRRRSSFLP